MSDRVQMDSLPWCQFDHGHPTPARYDGKTRQGPWAYMCALHFTLNGLGLGTGFGQVLFLEGEDPAPFLTVAVRAVS